TSSLLRSNCFEVDGNVVDAGSDCVSICTYRINRSATWLPSKAFVIVISLIFLVISSTKVRINLRLKKTQKCQELNELYMLPVKNLIFELHKAGIENEKDTLIFNPIHTPLYSNRPRPNGSDPTD